MHFLAVGQINENKEDIFPILVCRYNISSAFKWTTFVLNDSTWNQFKEKCVTSFSNIVQSFMLETNEEAQMISSFRMVELKTFTLYYGAAT